MCHPNFPPMTDLNVAPLNLEQQNQASYYDRNTQVLSPISFFGLPCSSFMNTYQYSADPQSRLNFLGNDTGSNFTIVRPIPRSNTNPILPLIQSKSSSYYKNLRIFHKNRRTIKRYCKTENDLFFTHSASGG